MNCSRLFPRIAGALFCTLACGFLTAGWQVQSALDGAIAGIQKRYEEVESIRADFRQSYRSTAIDRSESGSMEMKRPNLMRWEYRVPVTKLFVADGRDTYLYTPEDRQVLVRRYSADDLRGTPLQIFLGREDIRQNFEVAWETEQEPLIQGAILLRLVPRADTPEYAYTVIECDEGTYDVRRVILRERTGNTAEFIFSNVQTNVRIDNRKFQFKIPKGVEVVRMDEK